MVGSSIGRLHWPGSRRTLEGSASVFLSTLAILVLVSSVLPLPRRGGESEGEGGWWLWGGLGPAGWGQLGATLAWPVALVSLMEAFTTQVFVCVCKFIGDLFCPFVVPWFLFAQACFRVRCLGTLLECPLTPDALL